jgi:hypothetical protein
MIVDQPYLENIGETNRRRCWLASPNDRPF